MPKPSVTPLPVHRGPEIPSEPILPSLSGSAVAAPRVGPFPKPWEGQAPYPTSSDATPGDDGLQNSRGSPQSVAGNECFRLRHVLVNNLLDDGTLGLLLHGTSIVGFCTPQAEMFGWCVGDQIVEINGQRVVVFDEFLDRFVGAQAQGFPIDFSVLRREAVEEACGEPADDSLDGFFNQTDISDLAGRLQKKFGTGSAAVPRESLTPSCSVGLGEEEGDNRLCRSESITENPYIQALRKRRDELWNHAEGWIIDEESASLAARLATKRDDGLATLLEPAHRPKPAPLGFAGCIGGGRQCAHDAACLAAYDIQPTPRIDVETEACRLPDAAQPAHWATSHKDVKKINFAQFLSPNG